MDGLSSSASTVPSIDDYFEHNMWNPLLELIFLEPANGIFASYLVEIDLAMIALSCHFALDFSATKKACMSLHDASSGTIAHGPSLFSVAPLSRLRHSDLFVVDATRYNFSLLS